MPFSPPGPVRVLRALVVVQGLAVLVGAVQSALVAIDAGTASSRDALEGFLYGAGAFVFGALALVALVTVGALAGLRVGLRDNPPRKHLGVLIVLGIVELVLLVPSASLTFAALSDPVDLVVAAVPGIVTLTAVVVCVLVLLPPTRRWAQGPVVPAPPPGPYWTPGPPTAAWPPPNG